MVELGLTAVSTTREPFTLEAEQGCLAEAFGDGCPGECPTTRSVGKISKTGVMQK